MPLRPVALSGNCCQRDNSSSHVCPRLGMCQHCCSETWQIRASCAWIFLASFQIRELVPESQAYMDLLAFERKLDQTIMRKRVDIQEALKRPMKVCCEKFIDCVRGRK